MHSKRGSFGERERQKAFHEKHDTKRSLIKDSPDLALSPSSSSSLSELISELSESSSFLILSLSMADLVFFALAGGVAF